jgi:hypothetical protein
VLRQAPQSPAQSSGAASFGGRQRMVGLHRTRIENSPNEGSVPRTNPVMESGLPITASRFKISGPHSDLTEDRADCGPTVFPRF